MKKVVFLIQSHSLPSSRVRVLNLIPELSKYSICSEAIKYPKSFLKKLKLLIKCNAADVVVVQKNLVSYFDMFLIRLLSKKLVFDFDDAVYCRQDSNKNNYKQHTRYKKFINVVTKADCLFAGNSVLAKAASEFNKDVEVIPSAVETRHDFLSEHVESSNAVIIGWVGTPMTLPYLELLGSVLRKLAETYNFELRILCSESVEMPGVNVQFVPWSIETQEQEIAKFEIGVMPLPDAEYAAGKCGYKALQYMAAAVPPVVSDVGINHELVLHRESGIVCEKLDDFYEALKELMEEPVLRKKLGREARQRVEKEYSVHVVASKMAQCLNRL